MASDTPIDDSGSLPSKFAALGVLAGRFQVLAGWANQNRLRSVAIGIPALLIVAAVGIALSYDSVGPAEEEHSEAIAKAFQALDRRSLVEARDIVDSLKESDSTLPEYLAARAYILGAAAAYEAETAWTAQAKERIYLVAARYLEESRDRGFPENRVDEGSFLLGTSLLQTGRHAAARLELNKALKLAPSRKTEVHGLLAVSFATQANPDSAKALEHNAVYLADPLLSDEDRQQGLLRRSRILLDTGDDKQALAVIETISPTSRVASEALVVRAQLVMRGAEKMQAEGPQPTPERQQQIDQRYQEAIRLLGQAQSRDTRMNQSSRKAMYLIGICRERLRDIPGAVDQFQRTAKLHFEMPEGLAANLALGDLHRRQEQDDEAVAAYTQALKLAGRPQEFRNPWITLDGFRDRLVTAYEAYLQANKYDHAVRLAERFYPTFSATRTLQLSADAQRRYAKFLEGQAAALSAARAEVILKEARLRWRKAGRIHARIAKRRIATRHYPQDIWQTAESLLAGHDYKGAVGYLSIYLKNESRLRRPLALVGLGDAYLALGKTDQALEVLNECIEYHSEDPATYRARLLGAKAYQEKNQVGEAEALLKENRFGARLTPSSPEWRDSLFALGRLFHGQGSRLLAASRQKNKDDRQGDALEKLEQSHAAFRKAVDTLGEAVERYPDDPQTVEARYLLAESSRHSTALPEAKLQDVTIDAKRQALLSEKRDALDVALEQYKTVQELLNRRQETEELTPLETSILRNCYFARGHVHFSLRRWENAVAAYSAAANRFQNSPEALNAYFQIAASHRRLGQPNEARGKLEQALVVLNRMKVDDARFTETTSYTKEEWIRLLQWLIHLDRSNGETRGTNEI